MEFGDLTPPGYDHLDAGIRPSNRKQRAPKLSGRSSRLPVGCGTGMAKGKAFLSGGGGVETPG
jgi:hypothetical protein